MPHHIGHLITSVAALAATLAVSSFTANNLVRRKLRLSTALFSANPALVPAQADDQVRSFEQLALAAGLINLVVVGIINPIRADRVPDAFPSILQDAIVIGLLAVVATFVFQDKRP